MVYMEDCRKFVYKISYFKSNRHFIPAKEKFYKNLEDVKFVFLKPPNDYYVVVSVEHICKHSNEYKSIPKEPNFIKG